MLKKSHSENQAVRFLGIKIISKSCSSYLNLDVISDNEGNMLAASPSYPLGYPHSYPGPSDNRLLDPDPTPYSWFSEQRKSPRCISRATAHPFNFEPPIDDRLFGTGGRPTVQFSGCIISRAFLKERPSERLVGSLIGRALLANADALCAAATPMMNNVFDV